MAPHILPRFARPAAAWLVLMLVASRAHAQEILLLDPSARAGGMGGASVAVGWGGTPNLWANPALVNASRGFGVQVTTQQLVPGLDGGDLPFATTRLTASIAGLGFSSTGRPLGGDELDFGPPFVALERVRADGFGLSAAGLVDAWFGARGRNLRLSDYADVAWGRQWKRLEVENVLAAFAVGAHDEGWYVRATPIDTRRGVNAPMGGLRIDVAYGHAELDQGHPALSPGGLFGLVPLPVMRRDGAAIHLLWLGPVRTGQPGAAFTDAFRGGLSPVVNLTLAWDRERVERPGFSFSEGSAYDVNHYGLEATVLRLLAARFGYLDDASGLITKPTWGFGLHLPVSRTADVRYDFASWPQSYPRRVYRHEVALRLDPLARWMGGHDDEGEGGTP